MKRLLPALRPLLACFALLLAAAPARAQFLWQTAVGTAARSETAEYMIAVPGGFVTAGQSSNTTQFDDTGLYLSKVNYTGDTLWTHRITFAGVNIFYPKGLIVDAAGNLVVSATTFTPPATPTAPPSVNQGLLVKLTPAGDTIWTRTVRNPADASLTSLVLGNDGSYVVVGSLGSSPVLYKYSTGGTVLWTQFMTYSSTHQGYLSNLVAVPNGYVLAAVPIGLSVRPKFITIDESGNYQFERLFPRGTGVAQLKLTAQGDLLAIGGSITKLSVQGDSVWSHAYQQFGTSLGLTRLVELPNGRYLVAGTRYNGPNRDAGFIVVDASGTRLRDTLLVRAGDENVAGVALTPTGNYVVAIGSNTGPIGLADQILFAYRNWDRLLPTRVSQGEPFAALSAYPNPTSGDVTLMAADAHLLTGNWTLYDPLGRAVQTGSLVGLPNSRVSLARQPVGLYLLRVTDTHRHTTQTLRLEKN